MQKECNSSKEYVALTLSDLSSDISIESGCIRDIITLFAALMNNTANIPKEVLAGLNLALRGLEQVEGQLDRITDRIMHLEN